MTLKMHMKGLKVRLFLIFLYSPLEEMLWNSERMFSLMASDIHTSK